MKRVVGVILGIIGVLLCIKGIGDRHTAVVAVSIIGGADGPTSVFLAGKVGTGLSIPIQLSASIVRFPVLCIILGIILLVISLILIFGKKK